MVVLRPLMRTEIIRLFKADKSFLRHIDHAELEELGTQVEPQYWERPDGKVLQGYRYKREATRPSNANHSPTAISAAECIANVGRAGQGWRLHDARAARTLKG
jgi:hypothetical protein